MRRTIVTIGIIVALLASVAMERIAFRAMRGASVTSLLITSFAVSEIVKVLFQNGISARPVPIVLPAWMSGSLNFGFLTISVMSVISIIVVAVSLVVLSLILTRTTLGVAIGAVLGPILGVLADYRALRKTLLGVCVAAGAGATATSPLPVKLTWNRQLPEERGESHRAGHWHQPGQAAVQ